MMFSSIEARDLPFRAGQAVTIHEATLNGEPASLVVREYVQHNKPNPVLVELREELPYRAHDGGMGEQFTAAELAQEWLAKGALSRSLWGHHATVIAQIDHARKVLTHLAALTKENTPA
ncbi:hypothetical protein [Microbacterium sp. zg-YB36]|uniref:hypothetical protein n=1 Tax=Microbacterium sp. zg-YB36 TaxID=2969407 RepID=UPI00214B9B4B|nr:hypothetical protein [Microbacterium sp. zg-YB36]MDL5351141.1 hypothetical protein [Microbacterium sp. zg-YB36]